jgi:hypothetical protein
MTLQESKQFPRTYGDFPIKSSDGVIAYFLRSLLQYMSPVFDDMISISSTSNANNRVQEQSPLKVPETSVVLERFLSHLDPRTSRLSIDESTIEDLLELGRKYQVQSILDWFEEEVLSLRTKVFSSSEATPLDD